MPAPSTASTSIAILYNANADPARQIRNPDNIDWSADGYLYMAENAATPGLFGEGAVNPHEASVLRLDPATAAVLRVAEIDRSAAGPFGATDAAPSSFAAWESSGIVDVSALFGRPPGALFLADVQAGTIVDGPIAAHGLGAGGQLVLIAAPGVQLPTPVEIHRLDGYGDAVGSRFADTLVGSADANRLWGGGGADAMDGGAGDDLLRGGKGDDVLLGRDGGDRLFGQGGRDGLTGGADADSFVFTRWSDLSRKIARTDTITDFEPGLDRIHLARLDARPGHGDQAFRWIGEKAFHDRPGELRYEPRGTGDEAYRLVEADRDGDGSADLRLKLMGAGPLDKGDFVL